MIDTPLGHTSFNPILAAEWSELSAEERTVLSLAEQSLAEGLELYRWWLEAESNNRLEHLPLVRQLHTTDTNYGFLSEAPLERGLLPVLGVVQEMFYDQPRAIKRSQEGGLAWYRAQLQEFVLKYFLRTSWQPPNSHPSLRDLSWYDLNAQNCGGWRFQQFFYKHRRTGELGMFAERDRSRIVDIRKLIGKSSQYEWVVLKVQLLDFYLTRCLLGVNGPRIEVPMRQDLWIIIHEDFCIDIEDAESGILAECGPGWAVIPTREPSDGTLAYGPERLLTTFEFLHFKLLENGEIRTKVVFVSNKPTRILNLDPIDLLTRVSDTVTLGSSVPFSAMIRRMLYGRRSHTFDPLMTFIVVVNAMTSGIAAREFCISNPRLYRDLMIAHFLGLYNFVLQTKSTWCQVPDWLDRENLPKWVDGFDA